MIRAIRNWAIRKLGGTPIEQPGETGAFRSFLIELLGGALPEKPRKRRPFELGEQSVSAKLGLSTKAPGTDYVSEEERGADGKTIRYILKKLAIKHPEIARQAAGELVGLEAAAAVQKPTRSALGRLVSRVRVAVGSALVAGLGHVQPNYDSAAPGASGRLPLQLQESLAGLPADVRLKIQEALGGSLLGDRGTLTQNEDIGFRPLSERAWGKRTRDLTILSHREAINVSLWLYTANPLAEWLVDTPVNLTVGQEISYTATIDEGAAALDENAPAEAKDKKKSQILQGEIRKVLDRFWYHPAHSIAYRAPDYARTFLVTGHLVLPITARNEIDGCCQLDLVDAFQITGVNPLKGSAISPGFVRFTPMDAGAVSAAERAYAVLHEDPITRTLLPRDPVTFNPDAPDLLFPSPAGAIQVPDPNDRAQTMDAYAAIENPMGIKIIGECLYFRNAKLLNSMRGVPYLTGLSDYLDALNAFMWTSLDRAKLRNNMVWHLLIKGISDPNGIAAKVNEFTEALAANPNGMVYGSNENVTPNPIAAKIEGNDTVAIGRMILTYILGSKGMPESWYSHGGGTNKATAGDQTDVAYKTLLALQDRFRGIFRTILHMAYDSAQKAQPGKFPLRATSPWLELEPIMPVLQERDTSRLAAAAAQLAVALEQANASKFLSIETSRKVFLSIMGQVTGGAFEADIEETKIEDELAQGQAEKANAQAVAAKAALGTKVKPLNVDQPEALPMASQMPTPAPPPLPATVPKDIPGHPASGIESDS